MTEPPMKGLFVSGTGTDVGKTVVTAALNLALWRQGCPVLMLKPVQTGVGGPQEGDAACCAAVLARMRDSTSAYASSTSAYALGTRPGAQGQGLPAPLQPRALRSFALAASPHLAARAEGAVLETAALAADVAQAACAASVPLLLEGAGGVMVPLNQRENMLDLMLAVNVPVLVVMRNELGALNQTLLTLEAIQARGLTLCGVVVTRCTAHPLGGETVCEDNVAYLRARVPLWEVPFVPHCDPQAVPKAGPKTGADTDTDAGAEAPWDALATALAPLAQTLREQWFAEPMPGPQMEPTFEPASYSPSYPASYTASEPFGHTPQQGAGEAYALLDWDKAHLWHPYTSALKPLPVLEVARTEGTRIVLRDGRSLVDGMASWWCAIHGYGHPHLVRAAREQAGRMAHVMFGGLTHAPAVTLGQKLLPLLPSGLSRLFWADSGSVAVEVALKMALQCQMGRGEQGRTRILAPLGGYHGDTLGAMSVCDPHSGMHQLFRGTVAQQVFVPRPACRFDAAFDPADTQELEAAFAAHGQHLAAAIVEPVVQGAGGMWFYHPRYLQRLRALCDAYGVLLILDEIATGFGRTGRLWGAQWADISPDIMCLGKGLTGGFMTLAASVCTEAVASGICARDNVFMHGPTFMGNPLACAVGAASLDLLLASPWQQRVATLERRLTRGLAPCRHLPGVADVRVLGGIGVVETEAPVPVEVLQAFFVQRGVWIRPFGRLVYLMPPYVASEADVEQLTTAVVAALQQGVHLA